MRGGEGRRLCPNPTLGTTLGFWAVSSACACLLSSVIVVLVCFIAGAVAGGEKEEWGAKMRVWSDWGERPFALFLLICRKVSVSLYREG